MVERNHPTKIDLSKPRYDQSTFLGRFKHFLHMTDFRTLFTSNQKLEEAKKIVSDYQYKGIIPNNDPELLWSAQKTKQSILHPDTGKKIPWVFRISAFVPVNAFITGGMLLPGGGIANQLFWQWINQTYNICLNHCNRNASNTMSNQEIAGTYAAAVTASCGIAVGFSQFAKLKYFSPAVRHWMNALVPFFAVSGAGIVNVFLMRRNEVKQGIYVKTGDDVVVGKSKNAGWQALKMVAASRVATSMPVLAFAPLLLNLAMKTNWLQRNPKMVIPVNLAIIVVLLQTFLPVAISLFPQTVSVPVSSLEPDFQNLKDKNGNRIETLYYNRGL